MKATSIGFFIERLAVTGPRKTPAELTFVDGLNVVAGASDTGKSYAVNCIDFAFGRKEPPEAIPESAGYDSVEVVLRSRASGDAVEITRTLSGGDVRLRNVASDGTNGIAHVVSARHDPNDEHTLSHTLLELSGFKGCRVLKNKRGDMRSLSFRDLAFMSIVDEERIIAKRAPQLSGSPIEKTVEGDVFRLMVTGVEAGATFSRPSKRVEDSLKAQLDLIQRMLADAEAELSALRIQTAEIEPELARLEEARQAVLADYERSKVELVHLEGQVTTGLRALREKNARGTILETLLARFGLLDEHYNSDSARLAAIEEAGSLLASMPSRDCPLCGAAPEDHRAAESGARYDVENVREAAHVETAKLRSLREDLAESINELVAERKRLDLDRAALLLEVQALQKRIGDELQPRVRVTVGALRIQAERAGQLYRARAISEQCQALRARQTALADLTRPITAPSGLQRVSASSADVGAFTEAVEAVLQDWRYPADGRVVFSELDQDLVIAGESRSSHGKGVRAITCSAFIVGLLRHCLGRGLPHPGLVVLDSPLVAYREPDTESQILRKAGVKDAFFRSLASGSATPGQVIVFENEDPPKDLASPSPSIHFSKAPRGRYGFFPKVT